MCRVQLIGERPAFENFYSKVFLARQRLIVKGGTGLGSALVEVGIHPDSELAVAGSHYEALGLALEKVLVLAGPLESLEVSSQPEEIVN